MSKTSLLRLKNVSKFYYNKGVVASGFTKVNLELNLGEFIVITGESGSGKSTLLNVLSGLDTYEEGEMYINGEETSHYTEKDMEDYRKTYIGNIFQSFNLVNSYTVYQNLELVLLLNGYKKKDIKPKINELIDKVGLTKYKRTKVSKLSGGQKQRVAIARALAKDTPIIIADEPTGNLDSASAKSVLKLLADVSKDKLVVLVTHNYDQVEKYATRKLEMHDGKIREDSKLKEISTVEASVYEYKDLTLTNKVLLGIRNTFNIFSKFILTFIVFLFVTITFLGEFAGVKSVNSEDLNIGYNSYFTNYDTKRIVLKKNDKTSFTTNDFKQIKKINHITDIYEDDIFLDNEYEISEKEYAFSFWGKFDDISKINKVTAGKMPQNDNEIVVLVAKGDFYASDKIFNKTINIFDSKNGTSLRFDDELIIVGYIEVPINDFDRNTFYANKNVIEKLRLYNAANYSSTSFTINNQTNKLDTYEYSLIPNKKIEPGQAYISSDMNYLCKDSYCINKNIEINTKNLYFEEIVNLNINATYNKYNYHKLTGRNDFNEIYNTIFISYEDYKKLYDKESFQSSIYVDDELNLNEVSKKLNKEGYNTLILRDNLQNDMETIQAVFKIFRVVIFVGLFAFLFFIAYFVIKLIQKSKNVYYATVRILGGSSKIVRKLIKIELFTIFHITYILVMLIVVLSYIHIININFITSMIEFLSLKDYIFIYLILFALSYLLASRYSRKLFKTSAMKAYTEEV